MCKISTSDIWRLSLSTREHLLGPRNLKTTRLGMLQNFSRAFSRCPWGHETLTGGLDDGLDIAYFRCISIFRNHHRQIVSLHLGKYPLLEYIFHLDTRDIARLYY